MVAGCRQASIPPVPAQLGVAQVTPSVTRPPVDVVIGTADAMESMEPGTTPVSATDGQTGATATPPFTGEPEAACGIQLSALPPGGTGEQPSLNLSPTARESLRSQVPSSAWPALARLLDAPGSVGLVAFQVGREAEGIYLNPDVPMPLASVAKLITLVAYAEAVSAGELNPQELIPLAELDRYYLPNFDLGAHRRAVNELRENGGIISPEDNPAVSLKDVAWMMIRHSSNAAADYLHFRLGQARIEATAVSLGLDDAPASHSAPCVFLGQFLLMANHTRGPVSDQSALAVYANEETAGGETFGRDLSLLAETYIDQEDFRLAEQAWRTSTRRPNINAQRFFAANLAPQGTAGAYARLMLRLAQNGLSNADSSYQARLILEWPNQFDANQETFSNIGYKNGSLPGVLTTAYYAYRWDDLAPVVVVLFFRDLPQQTYRQWRFDLPHDELARWLLSEPQAISNLANVINDAVILNTNPN